MWFFKVIFIVAMLLVFLSMYLEDTILTIVILIIVVLLISIPFTHLDSLDKKIETVQVEVLTKIDPIRYRTKYINPHYYEREKYEKYEIMVSDGDSIRIIEGEDIYNKYAVGDTFIMKKTYFLNEDGKTFKSTLGF